MPCAVIKINVLQLGKEENIDAFVETLISDHVATVRLCRGKVNALTDDMVKELSETFTAQDKDPGTRALVLTGTGAFFSFGFGILHFLSYSKSEFIRIRK